MKTTCKNEDERLELDRLINGISRNPHFSTLFNPKFYLITDAIKKQKLVDEFKEFKTYGITIRDIERSSEDLDNLQLSKIIRVISNVAKWIATNQNDHGYWAIISKSDLMNVDETLFKNLEAKIEEYSKKIKREEGNENIPNAWTNAIMTLILTKWIHLARRWGLDDEKSLSLMDDKIKKSREWLQANTNKAYNIIGWSPYIPSINGDIINTYDTGFAYLAFFYDMHKIKENEKINIFHKKILDSLLSPILRDTNIGAWYINNVEENYSERKLDVGATSYALTSLLKANEIEGKRDFAKNEIRHGIEWIIREKNPDGGWGDRLGTKSRIDRTCQTLMVLAKYSNIYSNCDYEVADTISQGVKYLSYNIRRFTEHEDIYCWASEEQQTTQGHPCFRNSSLVISTLLKCGLPIYSREIRRGVSGLLRLYNISCRAEVPEEQSPINSLDKAYFFCMLADYLKASLKP